MWIYKFHYLFKAIKNHWNKEHSKYIYFSNNYLVTFISSRKLNFHYKEIVRRISSFEHIYNNTEMMLFATLEPTSSIYCEVNTLNKSSYMYVFSYAAIKYIATCYLLVYIYSSWNCSSFIFRVSFIDSHFWLFISLLFMSLRSSSVASY